MLSEIQDEVSEVWVSGGVAMCYAERMHTVFVYGTLRTGASNAFRMRGARSLGVATISARLYRVHEHFPGILISDDEQDKLVGEVLTEVSDAHLLALDEYEGCAPLMPISHHLYRRVEVTVDLSPLSYEPTGGSETTSAWVWEYLHPVDETQRIKSGDWFAQ